VSKPNVVIVPLTSLSIVFGTQTIRSPTFPNCWAIASEPSPPIAIIASIPRFRAFSTNSTERLISMYEPSGWSTGYENGLPRFVV